MIKEKISQNIQDLIGEIGERMILFKLYELIHSSSQFEIFKNYSDSGYDIGIRNTITPQKVKIEAKTRQHLITTASPKNLNSCHFTLTENERYCADYLVGYWLEYNDFFVVPTNQLSPNKNKGKMVYKHIVTRYKKPKNGSAIYSEDSMPYLNNWSSILEFLYASDS